MTRAEFSDTHFKNCEFLGVNLGASDFDRCKFETTRFFNFREGFRQIDTKIQLEIVE